MALREWRNVPLASVDKTVRDDEVVVVIFMITVMSTVKVKMTVTVMMVMMVMIVRMVMRRR